ncbi:unnamed protein product [Porites evermanni]|uniref:DDE Tnp4 domain-containing protein n=2 Tax=Porites TaxID=46719 RepID=A0ABN8M490_9CNID|nr:unnamed protein product [Porites evermanni]CAH3022985.1 unnamed protein product [Porites evermanni]CAH3139995.1 unnamed protein product [Porites evermanni]CAH3193399.1 unnamed protein product [Porites evermanni]
MSFKEFRDLLVLLYGDEIISDEEFLLLYDSFISKNPDFPHENYQRFDLDSMNSAECKAEFRVEKHDLPRLVAALQLPPVFKCEQRSICDDMEGLCILLKRVAYPCRLSDLIPRFGRPVSVLSLISNDVIDYIYDVHGHRITQWNRDLLNPGALQRYAEAISGKGGPLDNCFGFVDGTVRPISRPNERQRIVYNGHKRVHALKFQSLSLPNGLIGNLFGPVEGRKHDAGMLNDSGLLRDLQQYAYNPAAQAMCIYGDLAYPLRVHLQTPFRRVPLTPLMQDYNEAMSALRISVEWLFGDVINSFKFLDYKKNLKIGLSSVGKMYVVCALLRNAITCLYGNNTSDYFGIEPPSLEQYFQ